MSVSEALLLIRPAAGEAVKISPESRVISIQFPLTEASIARENLDLVYTFDDGGQIVLKNFYTLFSHENLPEFIVNGESLAGLNFLKTLGEDLLPAASQEAAGGVFGGGAFFSSPSIALESGIEHLGGLQWGMQQESTSIDSLIVVRPADTEISSPLRFPQAEAEPQPLPEPYPAPEIFSLSLKMSVDESRLAGGSRNTSGTNETAIAGEFTINLHGDTGVLTISGKDFILDANGNADIPAGGLSWGVNGGTLTVTGISDGKVSYVYELDAPQDHSRGPVSESITVTVTTSSGQSVTDTIVFDVVDDGPVAADDTNMVDELAALAGYTSTVSVLDNDTPGGDGHITINGAGTPVVGLYGTLVMHPDGTYTYTQHPDVNVPSGSVWTDSFTYTITDADGSTSTASLDINLKGQVSLPKPGLTLTGNGSLAVDESQLPDGSQNTSGDNDATTSSTIVVDLYGHTGVVTVHGTEFVLDAHGNADVPAGGVAIVTDKGILTVTGISGGSISYTYTLAGTQDHSGGAVKESVVVTVTDEDGQSVTDTIILNVTDDAPLPVNDSQAVNEIEALSGFTSTTSVLDNDAYGSDGGSHIVSGIGVGTGPHSGGIGTNIVGTYGTLVMNADGTYSYKLNPAVDIPEGEVWTDSFTYTITDADGSTSSATLNVNLNGQAPEHWVIDYNMTLSTDVAYGETDHGSHTYDPSVQHTFEAGNAVFTDRAEVLHVLGDMQAGTTISMGLGNDTVDIAGDVFANTKLAGDYSVMQNSSGGKDIIEISGSTASGAYIGGDAASLMENSSGGSDSIVIGRDVNGSYIGGDVGGTMSAGSVGASADVITIMGNVSSAYVGGDAGSTINSSSAGSHDTITVAGSVTGSSIGGDAGSGMNSSSGGSYDNISIGGAVTNSKIAGDAGGNMNASSGGEANSITIDGLVTGSRIGGNAGITMNASSGGNGNTIILNSGASGSSYIGGDAGQHMENGSVGGSEDSISITGIIANATIGGDAAQDMYASRGGANDMITLSYSGGAIVSLNVGGDCGFKMYANSSGGDGDTIRIDSDTITSSRIGGDAGYGMTDSVGGAGDVIVINSNLIALGGNVGVGGDCGYTMSGSSGGAGDSITITGSLNRADVAGDAGSDMTGSRGGDADWISITDDVTGYSCIGGDVGSTMKSSIGGAGDSIYITGNIVGSHVGGDVGRDMSDNSVGGSGDLIVINSNVTGSSGVGGDAGRNMTNSQGGDNDVIIIKGSVASNVGGDAASSMTNSSGGNGDLIYIETLSGGNVGGDTGGTMKNSTAGADAIIIGTLFSGKVYGDGADGGGNTAADGSNIIVINSFGSSSTYTQIDGGLGTIANGNADILSFGSGVDHVTLKGTMPSLSMSFGAGDENDRTGNISVKGTEVFDGGSGNDIIDASGVTGDIVLRGGTGSDTLVSSKGATIFHWSARDIEDSIIDTIQGFNSTNGDTLAWGSGVSATVVGTDGSAVLNLTSSGGTQTVVIDGVNTVSGLEAIISTANGFANAEKLNTNIDAALDMAANLESIVQGS